MRMSFQFFRNEGPGKVSQSRIPQPLEVSKVEPGARLRGNSPTKGGCANGAGLSSRVRRSSGDEVAVRDAML